MTRWTHLKLVLVLVTALAPLPAMADDAEPNVVGDASSAWEAPDDAVELGRLQRSHRAARVGLVMTSVGAVNLGVGALMVSLSEDAIDGGPGGVALVTTGMVSTAGGLATMIAGTHATTRNAMMGTHTQRMRRALWSGVGMMGASIPFYVTTGDQNAGIAVGSFLAFGGTLTVVAVSAATLGQSSLVLRQHRSATVSAAPVWHPDMRGAMLRVSW